MRPCSTWFATLLFFIQHSEMKHDIDPTSIHHHRHRHKLPDTYEYNPYFTLPDFQKIYLDKGLDFDIVAIDNESKNEWVKTPSDHISELKDKKHQHWPIKREAVIEGDLVLGGLMMVHERSENMTCGPVMPQGGVQALETMLYTLDIINHNLKLIPGVLIGAHVLDDCDRDTYGLEMAVDFIKGTYFY